MLFPHRFDGVPFLRNNGFGVLFFDIDMRVSIGHGGNIVDEFIPKYPSVFRVVVVSRV
jgi:hypothetical protein